MFDHLVLRSIAAISCPTPRGPCSASPSAARARRDSFGKEATSGGSAPIGKAKNVIILRMRGAMTHIDTFDPKPGKEEQGETKVIPTKTAGVQTRRVLYEPGQAHRPDDDYPLRHHDDGRSSTGDVPDANNYRQIASIVHPAMGAMATTCSACARKPCPTTLLSGRVNAIPALATSIPNTRPSRSAIRT